MAVSHVAGKKAGKIMLYTLSTCIWCQKTKKLLADLGVDATVLDTAEDLGGTWYRNRYPGARFDSESYTYGYSFSKELLDEWHWKERFSSQPENLRYLNYVADKFDLRKYMQFNCRVEAAHFDEAKDLWNLQQKRSRIQSKNICINRLLT